MSAVIGLTEEGKRLLLADSARVSGLYVLGKPRVGKSWLLINLILQDMANGHGVFFLDPHGDAIDYLLHCPSVLPRLLVLRPDDPHFTFGINPLECSDIADATLRNDTFTKAKAVFDKLWRNTFEEKPWLQLILQNTIYAFIENRGLTLTEFSLFLRDPAFRAFVVSNMRYNRQVIDYWLKTFASKSKHDQEAQMEAAQTRVEIMLSHPYVRDIVGQSNSTINFNNLISGKRVILLRLSNSLSNETKKIIGTIVVSELLHAVQRRNERDQFCIFVDEFENYASFEDFSTLITQAPKLGIATTIAHHERYGQLNQDPAILGATAAIANKVLFQITPRDAQELAVEFAQKPPVERRFEQEYVISQEPVRDLLRGHHRPQVREFVDTYLRSLLEKREDIKEQMEGLRIERQLALDQAGLGRIDERMLDLEGRDSSYIAARRRSLDAAGQALEVAQLKSLELLLLFESGNSARLAVRKINKFLSATMRGILPGQEAFSTLLLDCIHETRLVPEKYREVLALYIFLSYGDQSAARCVPVRLAQKYALLPQAMEAIHRAYEEKTRNDMRKEWKALWDGYEQKRAEYIEDRERKKQEVPAGVRKKVTAWRYDTHWAMYHCTVRLIMAYILLLEYKAARDVLGPYQSMLFSHSWLGNLKEHNYWYGTVSEWIKEVKREITVFRNDKKSAVKYKRNYERERMGFVWFGWVAPYTGDDNMYYGPYFQGFLLDSFEAYLNRYGEGALVALSLICQAQEPNLWGDVVSVAENEDLKWGETKEEWERRHYAGYSSLCLPTLNGKAPFEIILALERLGNIIRGINVERDLAKYYWVAYDKNAYEGCRRVMREIEGKPKNFKLHEEILIKIHPAEVFGAWVLEEPRRWSSEKTALKGLESLRNEAAKEPSRRDRLYALCRESKAAAVYLERRALDIAHYGRDVADLTFPEPSLAGATRSQVSEVVDWMVSVIQRAQKRQENEKEQAQFKDQEQYLRKRQKEADGGIPYDKVLLPAVISERVLARGELEAAKDACFRELTAGDESEWDAKGVLRVITDLVHFCECLARPENQFMVPSGRYVEKEVNTRTEADMVNEAVRELVGLPKYTAYAKVLHWTGKIQTLEVPQACWNLEVAFPDRRYYKKRNEIEVEIIARQEGWKPAETDEPPPVHS